MLRATCSAHLPPSRSWPQHISGLILETRYVMENCQKWHMRSREYRGDRPWHF